MNLDQMDTQNQLLILVSTIVVASPLAILFYFRSKRGSAITNKSGDTSPKKVPISVNYHFSRKCNYECGFCFHTAKTSHVLTLEQAKEGLTKLKEAGMKKINFAGGEPFLYPKFLGELVVFCKQTLQLESVSIISNGSLIKDNWMEKYAKHLDILGISCDSFDEAVNVKIGRGTGKHIENIFKVSLNEFKIQNKIF
jgi:radical S-adenosyl methionine domain-containing protein 2